MTQPKDQNDAPFPPLTLLQRLWVLPILVRLPFAIAIGIFSENKGRSWSFAASIAATRFLMSRNWDVPTMRSFIGVTTSQAYHIWAQQEKQEVLTDFLQEGAKLHWIGPRRDRNQDRVLLYFHGGAFSLPARPFHFQFLCSLQKDVSASLGDVSVAVLEYSLTPDSPIPTQLRQANAALSHLLSKGISAANIVIGGDSAGGNLVLQLTSHILHPLPSIPAPPALAQPLAGAMLISPWCIYSLDSPSFTRNDGKDVIPKRSYAFLTDLVTPGLTPEVEPYCQPLLAPATWWNGLDTVCARVLVTAGENECPFDQVIAMSSVISDHVQDTVTVVEPGAVHDEVIVKFGKDKLGKDYDVIVGFLSRSLKGGS